MSLFSRSALLPALLVLAGTLSTAQAAGNPGTPGSGSATLPGLSASAAGTVTVRAGDTAYSLARTNGLTVDALLALNGLGAPDLQVGQVLRVAEDSTYAVQRGDTLYSLSRRYGLTVDRLLALNGLAPDVVLEVGQVLKVPGAPATSPVPRVAVAPAPAPTVFAATSPSAPASAPAAPAPAATTSLPSNWKDAAMSMLGIPYVFGGTATTGLDCSGFVLQVFSPLGVQLPRRSADQAQAGTPVALGDLQPGDLVFFDTVGRGRSRTWASTWETTNL